MHELRIRPARPGDRDDRAFLAEISPRLEAVVPPWVQPGALAGAVERSVLAAFDEQRDGEALLIAEEADGSRVGFAYLTTSRNVNGEPVGCVSELAVVPDAEGRGVATALLAAAESWSRGAGHVAVTLAAFCVNERALALYQRLGFAPNVLHLRKPL